MVMQKKGIELQFHWIFVMVAGAMILIFFFSLANKQRNLSDAKLQATLSADIENIFTESIISRGTAQRLPVPPQGIGFDCPLGCDCKFSLGRASRPFGDKAIFAPRSIEDQDMVSWALEFKLPYRVTNLLFLTNPNVKYYFVSASKGPLEALHRQVVKGIPPLIEYENISFSEVSGLKSGGHPYTKFVFFDPSPSFRPPDLDSSFRRDEFSAVKIDAGGVNFYEKDGLRFNPSGYLPWIGLSGVYAAVFAQDKVMYECGMQTVFRKLMYLSEIYMNRASVLQDNALEVGKLGCEYGDVKNPSSVAKSIIDVLFVQNSVADKLKSKLTDADMKRLSGTKDQLEAMNRALVQQSCPEVF